MKLTRLRLLGFKSFVEPTDFLIEPGLTGVVGPNGCGKSNLVEALRWVMGETSHKSLRAADMDDVIFAGTNVRPARNNAEVAMHIDNSSRKAPAQFNEHESLDVARRIEREKGSTYRINGREVRARDVQILLADASTGSRSPALVHQGRIGEIIQAKPEQRRRVLEEAAGISGLHARRHEAELRLRAAEQNLAAARRRHQPARRADGRAQDAGAPGGALPQYRRADSQDRGDAVPSALGRGQCRIERSRAGQEPGGARGRRAHRRTGAKPRRARRWWRPVCRHCARPKRRPPPACNASSSRAIPSSARKRAPANGWPSSTAGWSSLPATSNASASLPPMREAALGKLAAEEETLKREMDANVQKRANVETRAAEADAVLGAAEKTFGELTGALADLTARHNSLAQAARSHDDRLARLADETAAVEAELAALAEANAGHPDLAALALTAEQAQAAVTEAEAVALRAEAAHSGARQALDVARGPLAEAERRAQRLDTEAKTLARLLHVDTKNLWPAVIDDLTVEKGYETALGAALGDDLEAPVDPSAPMRWAGADIDPADPALPEGVRGPRHPCHGAARAGATAGADRRHRARGRPSPHPAAQARPAAGIAGRRPLALGRLLGRRQRADRRRSPARRQEPAGRHRGRTADGTQRGRNEAARR